MTRKLKQTRCEKKEDLRRLMMQWKDAGRTGDADLPLRCDDGIRIALWSQRADANGGMFGRDVKFQGIFSHFFIGQDCQFVCGRLASVRELDDSGLFPCQFLNSDFSNENVGPQLSPRSADNHYQSGKLEGDVPLDVEKREAGVAD
jgi:hypothetical protein